VWGTHRQRQKAKPFTNRNVCATTATATSEDPATATSKESNLEWQVAALESAPFIWKDAPQNRAKNRAQQKASFVLFRIEFGVCFEVDADSKWEKQRD
jgi:hypothetical protein